MSLLTFIDGCTAALHLKQELELLVLLRMLDLIKDQVYKLMSIEKNNLPEFFLSGLNNNIF